MLKGVLIVNLNPPYIGFKPVDSPSIVRNCTTAEIKELLVDLKIMESDSPWPLKEFILRLPGEYSRSMLTKYDLTYDCAA